MQCTRCTGLRVPKINYEGGTRIVALLCVHWGGVIDRVIALNRQRRPYPKLSRADHPFTEATGGRRIATQWWRRMGKTPFWHAKNSKARTAESQSCTNHTPLRQGCYLTEMEYELLYTVPS